MTTNAVLSDATNVASTPKKNLKYCKMFFFFLKPNETNKLSTH